MDSFIFIGDYNAQIQSDNLQQVIGSSQTILDSLQNAAQEECKSYLKHKYDTTRALQPITQHNPALTTYKATNPVYLNATVFNPLSTYALKAQVLYNSIVYTCTTAIVTPATWNANKWTAIGAQYTVYNAKLPELEFNYLTTYAVGDKVFYKDKVYTCAIATQTLSHEAALQLGQIAASPIINVFPDNTTQGVKYWGAGAAYTIPVDTLPTNTTYWTLGDNRDQRLLQICIDIILYHAHCRVAPQNVPLSRLVRYMGNGEDRERIGQRVLYPTYCALGWLQAAAIGEDITPNIPLLQPNEGLKIRFGGNTKNVNSY